MGKFDQWPGFEVPNPLAWPMKVIGYCRVSTDRQENSASAQEAKIRAQAMLREFDLLGVEVDENEFSGDLNRPGIQKVLELVRSKKVGAVIITKLDRITRSTRDAIELIELFSNKGVALISISESLDTESPMGRFFVRMIASIAELEREMIGARTSEGLQNLKASGFAAGPPPFGFTAKKRTEKDRLDKVRHQMEPNHEELRLGQKVNELRALRKSWREIAEAVNALGFRNRRGHEYILQDMHKIWKRMNPARKAA